MNLFFINRKNLCLTQKTICTNTDALNTANCLVCPVKRILSTTNTLVCLVKRTLNTANHLVCPVKRILSTENTLICLDKRTLSAANTLVCTVKKTLSTANYFPRPSNQSKSFSYSFKNQGYRPPFLTIQQAASFLASLFSG